MNNIDAGWRENGLYPFYPETDLSCIRTRLQTPPTQDNSNLTIEVLSQAISTPHTTWEIHHHVDSLLDGGLDLNTPAVKRVRTLGRAAEHALAQNALLTVENTRFLQQNKERTRCKETGNYVFRRARQICEHGLAPAPPQPPPLSPPPIADPTTDLEDLFFDDEDISSFAVEYIELYGDKYE